MTYDAILPREARISDLDERTRFRIDSIGIGTFTNCISKRLFSQVTKGLSTELKADKFVLEARSLSKSFGDRTLFTEVNLEIRPGEMSALLGPSGVGKSTLLNCLEGVETYDSGSVVIDNQTLESLDEDQMALLRREKIGTIFQFFHLLPTLTAFENIELPLQLIGMPEEERLQCVFSLLKRLNIDHRADAFPAQLSGGEMQRIAIARAIAHRPKIIFADEPTGNLDEKSGREALQLLTELCLEINTGLLMVTHSQDAAAYCDFRYTLADERLIQNA